MECSICCQTYSENDERVISQVCCVKNACLTCLRRWYGTRENMYSKACMVCRRTIDMNFPGTTSDTTSNFREQCAFHLDWSSFRNLTSSLWILWKTGACVNCGARIVHEGGCTRIRCTWCLHEQKFQKYSGEISISLLSGDTWYGRLGNRTVNWFVKIVRRACGFMERWLKLLTIILVWVTMIVLSTFLVPVIGIVWLVVTMGKIFAEFAISLLVDVYDTYRSQRS